MSKSINLDAGGRVELLPVFEGMDAGKTPSGYRLNVIQEPGALMSQEDLTRIASMLTKAALIRAEAAAGDRAG